MRSRALLGGLAFVSAVTFWHHRSEDQLFPSVSTTSCAPSDAPSPCTVVAGLQIALRSPVLRMNRTGMLPPRATPGEVEPSITQSNIDRTICEPGYARSVRPPYAVTGPLKRRMMKLDHPGEPMKAYELDHLIPISIGGAPLDRRNLWLQPREGQINAGDKNVLAYVLWRLVCEHRLPLRTAQRAISGDWTGAYATYATPDNVAAYRFRHGTDPEE